METFTADNGKTFEVSELGFISGAIPVDVNDLINLDLEGAMDLFADKLVGNELLSDISYEVIGARDGQIVMKITGSVEHILDCRNGDDETPPSGMKP